MFVNLILQKLGLQFSSLLSLLQISRSKFPVQFLMIG